VEDCCGLLVSLVHRYRDSGSAELTLVWAVTLPSD
jgi:hypothetical protein